MARQHHPLLPVALFLTLAACSSDGSPAASDSSATSSAESSTPALPTPASSTTSEAPSTTIEAADTTPVAESADQRFPDVVTATASQASDGTWTVAVTLSSPYDSPARYADAWRVLGPDGEELGLRVLTHDHAAEQPFTRSQSGIEIPNGLSTVTIEGRDQEHGWGGNTFELALNR